MPKIKHVSPNEASPSKIFMEFKNFEQKSMDKYKPIVIDEKTGDKLIIYAEDGMLKLKPLKEGL